MSTESSSGPLSPRPLDGVRVLELGQLMAGPFAGTILGYYGAEVIKVEPPGQGDAVRKWRIMDQGTSLWWRTLGRNKKCVTINLREERGRELVRRLAARCDVLLENFRPGTIERWGLGPDDLKADNPDLIFARVSGYGQTGPYASRPGYASVCEGVGGMRPARRLRHPASAHRAGASNDGRVTHQDEVDGAIGEWTATLTMDEVLAALEEARVPAGPINSVVEMVNDPHFQARDLFEEVEVGGRPLKLPAIAPRLSETPGRTDWAGPELGAHNTEIFGDFLGLSGDEIEALRRAGVI